MKEDQKSIEEIMTSELIDLVEGKKSIGVRWIYKVKVNPKGEIIKHKTQLVAKEFSQREGIDFEEEIAPMAIIVTIWLVVGVANNNNWSIYQMDIKSAFLNGLL